MGNSLIRTSNTNPQIICINPIENYNQNENPIILDNSDNSSNTTIEFDTTQQKFSQPDINEVYARRKYRRKAIIVAKTSRSLDETEIQNEN